MSKAKAAAAAESTPMKALLAEGVAKISDDESIVFTLYRRVILPLDGFVFWIKASITADAPKVTSLTIKGAIHRSVSNTQEEDQSQSLNHMIFTTTTRIDDFNVISSGDMWVCEIEGAPFSFASMRDKFVAAGLYHYRGDSISPIIRGQMISSQADLDDTQLVISNSLPIFMQLNEYGTVYPAFLVDSNVAPPYIVIDVKDTAAVQAAPYSSQTDRFQMARDTVRVTLIGLNNKAALQYCDYIVNNAMTYETFGIFNSPVVRDVKMIQSEINALAMKKTIDFEVNYYQKTANDIAKQLILEAFVTVEVES